MREKEVGGWVTELTAMEGRAGEREREARSPRVDKDAEDALRKARAHAEERGSRHRARRLAPLCRVLAAGC